jgi:hypothetical protein
MLVLKKEVLAPHVISVHQSVGTSTQKPTWEHSVNISKNNTSNKRRRRNQNNKNRISGENIKFLKAIGLQLRK